ncbi:MAG: right-handed parallel beta-helix repeat-containing protein [Candidatus Omnitrophica bacterium]|nr:right-handed parallel beta-helix repeat-containing protein [Candidatus Omnitrophota bacterium]
MKKTLYYVVLIVAIAGTQAAHSASLTLRSSGAIGDGKTDDRAAIQKALNEAKGETVDGEGLTYAVHGNIEVTSDVDFRNATLVQTMEAPSAAKYIPSAHSGGELTVDPPEGLRATVKGLPLMHAESVGTYKEDPVLSPQDLQSLMPSIAVRTLTLRGSEENPVKVRLENIKVDRGRHPSSGGRNDSMGILIRDAAPVAATDVEVTGDGKGVGLSIHDCKNVRLTKINIHDMNWAPYEGDNIFDILTAQDVRDDFHWNHFPIYEFRDSMKRFVRVRIQEQLVGLWISQSENVEVLDSTIDRLQVAIGGDLYPLQTDAMTVNRVKNIVARNSHFSKTWEGIDFTGDAGQGFEWRDCVAEDTLGFSFKVAHPKQNGKMINCRAERSALGGFTIGAESENIQLIDCIALETGAGNLWRETDGSPFIEVIGIRVDGQSGLETPKNILIERCSAINKTWAGAMDYGIRNEHLNKDPGHNIKLVDCNAEGAKIENIKGFGED